MTTTIVIPMGPTYLVAYPDGRNDGLEVPPFLPGSYIVVTEWNGRVEEIPFQSDQTTTHLLPGDSWRIRHIEAKAYNIHRQFDGSYPFTVSKWNTSAEMPTGDTLQITFAAQSPKGMYGLYVSTL